MIESPYRGRDPEEADRFRNYRERCIKDSFARGESPLASHEFCPRFLDDDEPGERQKGIEWGYGWGRYAEQVVFYVDYGFSDGMLAAFENYYYSTDDQGDGIQIRIRKIGR